MPSTRIRSRTGRVTRSISSAAELPGAGPDHEWLREPRNGACGAKTRAKRSRSAATRVGGKRPLVEIETLVDHRQREMFRRRDVDQRQESTIVGRRVLPAHNEAGDAGLLRPPDVLTHDVADRHWSTCPAPARRSSPGPTRADRTRCSSTRTRGLRCRSSTRWATGPRRRRMASTANHPSSPVRGRSRRPRRAARTRRASSRGLAGSRRAAGGGEFAVRAGALRR